MASPSSGIRTAGLALASLTLPLSQAHGQVCSPLGEAWSVESNQADAYFGASVASAGDVNGDGFDDAIVGAPEYDGTFVDGGRAYVYLGSGSGLDPVPHWAAEGGRWRIGFGNSVASAGDVNGDGFGDVIVGAPSVWESEGSAFVYYGSPAGLATTPGWSQTREGNFGFSVASAGDVNADGFDDVVVGDKNSASFPGRVRVFYGSGQGLSTTAAWIAIAPIVGAGFGYSVASAGDVDGNGFSDVIVGSPFGGLSGAVWGQAYVYLSSPDGLSSTPDWTQTLPGASTGWPSNYGGSVASAGDLNGDGFSDVVVGARHAKNGPTGYQHGSAFVYHGSSSGLANTPSWLIDFNKPNSHFGSDVASAGDIDGDGFEDLIVGAEAFNSTQRSEGAVFVYHGSPMGLSTTPTWTRASGRNSSYFGSSVAGAGDIDGDGHDDVLIGAINYGNGEPQEGGAFAFHGSPTGLVINGQAATTTRNGGNNPNSYVADRPVIGETMNATVDLTTTTGHALAQVFAFSAGGVSFPLAGGQTVLVTGTHVLTLPLQVGPQATWSIPIPSDPSLCGSKLYTQAAHIRLFGTAPFALSNAQDLTLGY